MIWRVLAILAGLAIGVAAVSGATDDKALGYFPHAGDAPAHVSDGYGATTVVGVLLLGGAGAWLLLRGRRIQLPGRVQYARSRGRGAGEAALASPGDRGPFARNRDARAGSGRVARRLVIDETKSLGSRQYLVVASYEGKKLLLGVCPGRIDLLTPLDGPASPQKAP